MKIRIPKPGPLDENRSRNSRPLVDSMAEYLSALGAHGWTGYEILTIITIAHTAVRSAVEFNDGPNVVAKAEQTALKFRDVIRLKKVLEVPK